MIPMCSCGETNATDLPSREAWMAVATAPDVEPYTTMSNVPVCDMVGRGARTRFRNEAIIE